MVCRKLIAHWCGGNILKGVSLPLSSWIVKEEEVFAEQGQNLLDWVRRSCKRSFGEAGVGRLLQRLTFRFCAKHVAVGKTH